MIIDCHAHVSAPVELWAYKAGLLSHRGAHGRGKVNVSDEQIRYAVEKHKEAFPHPHLPYIDKVGTGYGWILVLIGMAIFSIVFYVYFCLLYTSDAADE